MIQPTPVAVGTTAIVIAPQKLNRYKIRFQNVGETNLFFVRQFGTTPNVPSPTNYEFKLGHTGNATDFIEIESVAEFKVVSSGANGSVAIFETVKVKI